MNLNNSIIFIHQKAKTFFRTKLKKTVRLIIQTFLTVTNILQITSFESNINREKVFNRTLVLVDEAKRRSLKTEVLKIGHWQTRFFRISSKKKTVIFDSLPLGNSYLSSSQRLAENKWKTKLYLQKHHLPVPEGKAFRHLIPALDYAKKLDWPVVVKPLSSSLSQHVSSDISNKIELAEAIGEAKRHENSFLIEKQLNGHNYRILVIDNKVIGGLLRHPPFVISDGESTIQKLIKDKNDHPWRGETEQLNTTLHKIKTDKETLKVLASQNLTPKSVPKKDKIVYLHKKVNTASGADLYDVTEKIHPDNLKIFIHTAKIFDAKLLGIDFIAPDITKSYNNQKCGIIEVNTMPYIDMHHYPSKGKPRNVAGDLLEMLFPANFK